MYGLLGLVLRFTFRRRHGFSLPASLLCSSLIPHLVYPHCLVFVSCCHLVSSMLSCSFSSLPSISPSPPTTQSISLSAASTVHLVVTVSPAPLLLLSILLRFRRRSSMCNWKRQIYSAGVRTRQIYLFLSLRCTSTTPCCLRSLHLHPKSTWLLLNHIRPVPIQTPSPPLRTHTSLDEEASVRCASFCLLHIGV